jgi:hypothetical protein
MSDATMGSVFNPHFFMNPPWWIGRIESKDVFKDNIQPSIFDSLTELKGWGERYNVRIFNWHTGSMDKLPPEVTVKAQVVKPVTAGSGHGGGAETSSIQSGSVVFGFFMDGMAGQEPYIMGVLGNSNNNVPKEREAPAPTQTTTTPTSTSAPATPVSGPGSAANLPIPQNVNDLSIDQLKTLLNPAKTPSSAVFAAASTARQTARLQNLPFLEVERQVLIATVKASRAPGADVTPGNCNPGYQQFNDTYTDSNLDVAKVPDNLIINACYVLSDSDALHINTVAWETQDEDKKRKQALTNPCQKENSQLKGINLTIKNLIQDIEKIKKFTNDISSKISEVQSLISSASSIITGFLKSIMTKVRAYVMKKVTDAAKKVFPFLFPSETPAFASILSKSTDAISCAFNKLIAGLKTIVMSLLKNLLDKVINSQPCSSSNFIANVLNGSVIDQIGSIIDSAVAPLSNFISTISGLIGKISGSLFQALDYITGILAFFSCEEERSCPVYNEISLAGDATPGEDMSLGDFVESPQSAGIA